MNCHQELGDLPGMSAYVGDLEQGLSGLRQRGWDRRERDVFALLLQRISTAFLLADNGTGKTIPKALAALKEAETNLVIFCGEAARLDDSGISDASDDDERAKMKKKKFGPQVDNASDLLQQIRTSIRILEVSQVGRKPGGDRTQAEDLFQGTQESDEDRDATGFAPENRFEDLGSVPSEVEPSGDVGTSSTFARRDGLGSLRGVLKEVSRR